MAKAFGLISLLITVALIGWLMTKQAGGGAGAGGDLTTAKAAQDAARRAVVKSNLVIVQDAVKSFQAEKQRIPASLDELKEAGYLQSVPTDVSYDPQSGVVSPVQ